MRKEERRRESGRRKQRGGGNERIERGEKTELLREEERSRA